MSSAVQFMPIAEIFPAVLRLNGGKVDIEITVWLLGLCNKVNSCIDLLLEFGIWIQGQTVADRFNPFTRIGIPKDMRFRLAGFPVQTPCIQPSRDLHLMIN